MKNVLVVGSGISGMGAIKLGIHYNYNMRLTTLSSIDEVEKNTLTSLGVDIEEGRHSINDVNWANIIVKSPGVPSNIPLIDAARDSAIPIISEIEFAYRHTESTIIAITGTNGKTTTSHLIYHILKDNGFDVALVGNIGTSFSEQLVCRPADFYVVEISSFQLEDIVDFKPNISVILNIQPDHLDRYNNNFEKYIKTKMKIQVNQDNADSFIYHGDDLNIAPFLSAIKANKYSFSNSTNRSNNHGAFLDGDRIIINTIQNKFTMTIHNLALQGTHNIYNSMAASIAASNLGIQKEIIKKSLSNFKGVEHRLEFVGKISGVNFINDSKATNCNSVYYALDSITDPVIWICGGVDKGNDYSILKDLVASKVKTIIILGRDIKDIHINFKNCVNTIVNVDTMDQAVNKSFSLADSGDTVLLSPACASFDLFQNYEERGRVFKNKVLSI
ncbi:MAG: UDP-N-acetylmuramoyl-L-alanine--D-glutamate ligase [Flavobacteriales bacterium]|nr:UDP-N-acetylmuramoyl-L-alanine--D-glutamate ligase [Flavobacteriales bacterium]